MYIQARSITLMSVLVNIIIYDISKYSLGRRGPVQVIYVNEIKKLINTEFYFMSPR